MKAGVLVGIRSVYITLNEEEVMRLCCVNLCWAYRMLQLPKVYLLDVNHEHIHTHTHVQYKQTHSCRYSHKCKHTYRLCLYPFLKLLSSLYCDVLYLLNRKNSARWQIYKLAPNYTTVHSQCVCPFQTNFSKRSINYCLTSCSPFHINKLLVGLRKPKLLWEEGARCKRI